MPARPSPGSSRYTDMNRFTDLNELNEDSDGGRNRIFSQASRPASRAPSGFFGHSTRSIAASTEEAPPPAFKGAPSAAGSTFGLSLDGVRAKAASRGGEEMHALTARAVSGKAGGKSLEASQRVRAELDGAEGGGGAAAEGGLTRRLQRSSSFGTTASPP